MIRFARSRSIFTKFKNTTLLFLTNPEYFVNYIVPVVGCPAGGVQRIFYLGRQQLFQLYQPGY